MLTFFTPFKINSILQEKIALIDKYKITILKHELRRLKTYFTVISKSCSKVSH